MPNGIEMFGEISPLTSLPYQNPYQGQYYGIGRIPLLGDNPLMQTMGQVLGSMGIASTGMIPLGRGRENIANRLRDFNLTQIHDDMMTNIAMEERAQWMRGLRGLAAMTGTPWGEAQQRAAERVTDWGTSVAAKLAAGSPDMLDVWGGRRGSALALAEYTFRGGMHRMDPATGQVGLSEDSIRRMVHDIRTTMHSTDAGPARTRNVGMTMGQTGSMFAELQRHGFVRGGPISMEAMYGGRPTPQDPGYVWERANTQQREKMEQIVRQQFADAGQVAPVTAEGRIDFKTMREDMTRRVMEDTQMQRISREVDERYGRIHTGPEQYTREPDWMYERATTAQRERLERGIRRQYEAVGKEVPIDEAGRIDVGAIDRDPGMVDRLSKDLDIQDVSREFDSRRVISTLEKYGGAVKAMREIFGDAGNPNAPMSELINALNAMTGGAMAQVDPGRIEMMVRQTYNLAEQTGIGVPGMMALSQTATAMAQQMGLNPLFANEAVRGALAMQATAQQQGLAGYQAWGRGTPEQWMQKEQQLRLAAAGSMAGNQLGALLRIRQQYAAAGQETPFGEGALTEQYLRQVRAGQRRVTLRDDAGNVVYRGEANMQGAEFMEIMKRDAAAAGIPLSEATISQFIGQRSENQRVLFEDEGMVGVVRNWQTNDASRRATDAARWSAETALSDLGIFGSDAESRDAQSRVAATMAQTMARAITEGVDPGIITDEPKRNAFFARRMEDRLRTAAADTEDPMHAHAVQIMQRFAGRPEQMAQWLTGTAGSMWGGIEEDPDIRRFYGGAQDFAVLQNEQLQDANDVQMFRSNVQSRIDRAVAPIGGGGMVQRGIQAVIEGGERGEGTSLLETLSASLGAERAGRLLGPEGFGGALEELAAKRQSLKDQLEEWQNAQGEDRERIAERIRQEAKVFEEGMQQLSESLERGGIRLEAPVSDEEIGRALSEMEWTQQQLEDLRDEQVDLGEFLDPITQEQLTEAAEAMGRGPGELMAMNAEDLEDALESAQGLSEEQKEAVRRGSQTINLKMEEQLRRMPTQAMDMAYRMLEDEAGMAAGGEELMTSVTDVIEAGRELEKLEVRAGGTIEAARGEEYRDDYERVMGRMRRGMEGIMERNDLTMRANMTEEELALLGKAQEAMSAGRAVPITEEEILGMSEESIREGVKARTIVERGAISQEERERLSALRIRKGNLRVATEAIQEEIRDEDSDRGRQLAEVMGLAGERLERIRSGEEDITAEDLVQLTPEQVGELQELAGGTKELTGLQADRRAARRLAEMGDEERAAALQGIEGITEERLQRLQAGTAVVEDLFTEAELEQLADAGVLNRTPEGVISGPIIEQEESDALALYAQDTPMLRSISRRTGKGVDELLDLSAEELQELAAETRTERGQALTEEEITKLTQMGRSARDSKKRVKEGQRRLRPETSRQIMAGALTQLTGVTVTDPTSAAFAKQMERLGGQAYLEAMEAGGEEGRAATAKLRQRAEVVGTLREVRGELEGMEDKSLEQMLFTREGGARKARTAAWFTARGVGEEELRAIKEAQGWATEERGWYQMEERDLRGEGGRRAVDMGEMLSPTNRTPTTAGGAGGRVSIQVEAERVIVDSRNRGPGTARADGESNDLGIPDAEGTEDGGA